MRWEITASPPARRWKHFCAEPTGLRIMLATVFFKVVLQVSA